MTNQNGLNIGVLVSGNGSNLEAIALASKDGTIGATVAVVVSDNKDAFAIERAKKNNIPYEVVLRKDFENRNSFEEKIVSILKEHGVGLVCLAGFMRIIGKVLLEAFPERIMNVHPALLPSFPGLDAQKQTLDHGVKVSGCTVHFVDGKVDHGPIIIQESVSVRENDTVETLKARILEKEHEIYPKAIGLFAEKRLKIVGRRVYITDKQGE